jgi:hypothetical protein
VSTFHLSLAGWLGVSSTPIKDEGSSNALGRGYENAGITSSATKELLRLLQFILP